VAIIRIKRNSAWVPNSEWDVTSSSWKVIGVHGMGVIEFLVTSSLIFVIVPVEELRLFAIDVALIGGFLVVSTDW
jgi:hypothetical protein